MRGCVLACFLAVATAMGAGNALSQGTDQPANTPTPSGAGGGNDSSDFWSRVNLDPAVPDAPVSPLRASRSPLASKPLDVKRSDNPDGTGSISIDKSLATPWDAKIGSSFRYSDTSSDFDPTRPLPAAKNDDQSRAVWADVAVPDVGSINTRIDTGSDRGKYGTSIARSVSLGNHLSVTAQDNFSVTESYGTPTVTSAIPLAAIPAGSSAPAPSQIWANERKVNLNVLSTGTTFGAAWTAATGDPVTHNTFSADQKLYGSLHVTTSVSDAGQPTASKSVTAGFKMNW